MNAITTYVQTVLHHSGAKGKEADLLIKINVSFSLAVEGDGMSLLMWKGQEVQRFIAHVDAVFT